MIRYLAPIAVVFALASAAHAQTNQTYSRTVVTTDGFGNSSRTTIEAPATVAGIIAAQTVYPNYGNTYAIPSYGANCPPGYGYPAYGYPAYGYPAPYPPAYPYGYPPQAYYVPSQTTPIGIPSPYDNFPPPSITTAPQVITTPGYPVPGQAVPAYPYGGYAPYNYGWNSRTTVARGGVSYNRGGLSFSVGGGSIIRR